MAVLLLIVSRSQPSRFEYLKHVFGDETVDVILDRRVKERRQRWEGYGPTGATRTGASGTSQKISRRTAGPA